MTHNDSVARALVATVLLLAGASCTLRTASIDVILPALPQPLADLPLEPLHWDLFWWDGRAVRRETVGVAATGALPGDGADTESGRGRGRVSLVTLPLDPRGSALPLVVGQLSLHGGGVLPPAAGWTAPDGGSVALSWADGAVGAVLLGLARDGLDPALVNVERLAALAREVTDDGRRTLDAARLERALRSQAMRSSAVARQDEPIVEIRRPVEFAGPLIGAPPAPGPYEAVVAGPWAVWAIPCAPGSVRHLWTPGGERIVVARDRDGHATWRLFALPRAGPTARRS